MSWILKLQDFQIHPLSSLYEVPIVFEYYWFWACLLIIHEGVGQKWLFKKHLNSPSSHHPSPFQSSQLLREEARKKTTTTNGSRFHIRAHFGTQQPRYFETRCCALEPHIAIIKGDKKISALAFSSLEATIFIKRQQIFNKFCSPHSDNSETTKIIFVVSKMAEL